MPRYFLEVRYDGSSFSGFQVQKNARTIQSEIEKAAGTLLRITVNCTGSSRTDAGVHAMQNYFHFDVEQTLEPGFVYHLNAILPKQIAVVNCTAVRKKSHCRFDAVARWYKYMLSNRKDPFLVDRAWFYPYPMNKELLDTAAGMVKQQTDFTSFSKRHADTKTTICSISRSEWFQEENGWVYHVEANRFLRGMVRGLVSTMVQVGRQKISLEQFNSILHHTDNALTSFTAPGHGLYLMQVRFPDQYLEMSE
ncbi:tRNA pseudouridine(38-40) synthase TruA [Pollutibacter soli]|uniref:tRNA pseudouridine(38-40) synthase TruA n=1 Tax=Pollutibacter soli TaxID=3034157 RepID=UPI003013326D